MRRFWIIVGIVLSTFAVIALLNILIMAAQNGFHFGDVERKAENIRKEEKINLAQIDSVKLNFKISDVNVMVTDEEELRIVQYSNKELEEKELFYVTTNGNELTVYETKKDVKFSFNLFNMRRMAYDIYIPKNYEGSIYIESVSGDIFIDKEVKLKDVEIKSTSGDITFNSAVSANKLNLKTVSGDIKLDNVNSNELILESTSGDINVGRTTNYIEVKTVSGDITINGATGKISVESTSGDISGHDFNIREKSNVKTVSGDIKISLNKDSNCKINTKTTSGDIKLPNGVNVIGNEPYADFDLKTTSGDIHVD